MGLIKALGDAVGSTFGDMWLEFFVCESLESDVLAAKGQKKVSKGSNTKGSDNIISKGSGVVVNKGQAAIIISDGRVADICAEEGRYTFEPGEATIFSGGLGKGLLDSLKNMGDRFKYGGQPGKDQRIYYFNTKEIMGNKYGTPNPIPYKISDPSINLNLIINLKVMGEYSFRITNPALFYANVCGNVEDNYTFDDKMKSQLKSELLTALQTSLGKLGKGLEYHEISYQTEQLAEILNEALSAKWRDNRGIEIVNFGITLTATKEDEDRIKQLQTAAVYRDPTMAAASLVGAQGDAMRAAASNQGGAMTGFMGMGMAAGAGGMNPQALFAMGQQQAAAAPAAAPAAAGWTCECGHAGNTGKFCAECGKPQPAPAGTWTCSCGHAGNTGKFCAECGKPNENGPWDCACGHKGNTGKFCAECGKPRA